MLGTQERRNSKVKPAGKGINKHVSGEASNQDELNYTWHLRIAHMRDLTSQNF